ncbi:hypothetical protein EHS13_08780 [Paenibacillus psychroresistens]|uniref:Uncharacterized protein n=1 Tax=Paenibacillus psychroresistens TaxID=1778678 RepID=A0A6B8RFT0_9BACL|nr:hypothetical protein [Paenibacillus psychroresistens]QGQ94969.1 hypothetical protein EHS13_08780 [Paenibacillus psychroresistens]
MNFLGFMIFSPFEYIAIFILMFSLFRFNFDRFYTKRIIFASILLSCLSFTMRAESLTNFNTPVIGVLLFIFVWLMFEVRIFHALIMSISVFIAYGLIQATLITLFQYMNIFDLKEIESTATGYTFPGFVIAIISILIFMIVAWIIKKRNSGFDFVSHDTSKKNEYNGINILLSIGILITATITAVTYYLILDYEQGFYLMALVLLFTLIIILYLSNRKDLHDAEVTR